MTALDISQMISFFAGVLTGIAFVLASSMRFR